MLQQNTAELYSICSVVVFSFVPHNMCACGILFITYPCINVCECRGDTSLNCHRFIHLLYLHKLVDTFQNECSVLLLFDRYSYCRADSIRVESNRIESGWTEPYTIVSVIAVAGYWLVFAVQLCFFAQSIFPIWFVGEENFHHKSLCD